MSSQNPVYVKARMGLKIYFSAEVLKSGMIDLQKFLNGHIDRAAAQNGSGEPIDDTLTFRAVRSPEKLPGFLVTKRYMRPL